MILDLSGFMFSGKSALSDLLREVEEIYVPNHREEFDLLRIGGGLIDFKNAVNDWSPIRTYSASLRFEKVLGKYAGLDDLFPIYNFLNHRPNWNWKKKYPNILEEYYKFKKNIVDLEWETKFQFQDISDDTIDYLFYDIKNRYSNSKKYKILLNFIKFLVNKKNSKLLNKYITNDLRKYYLINKNIFLQSAQDFVRNILYYDIDTEKIKIRVVHNALDPFDPAANLDLLGVNSKSIIVDRDPRDIFVTSLTYSEGFNDNIELYKLYAAADNINKFIRKYNLYRNNIVTHSNVLRINFNDLIKNYEITREKIFNFLNIDESNHINKYKFFDPVKSSVNNQMYKLNKYSYLKKEFKMIENECL